MIDPNLDPEVEAQLRAFMASAADLSTATIQLDNLALDDIVRPIQVDENYLTRIAAEPDASPQLRHYAAQVDGGYCTWAEIESRLASNLPPEIVTLKSSPGYQWPWRVSEPEPPESPPPISAPAPRPAEPGRSPARPRRQEPETVGPSDWPDDFDDHPDSQRSWLV